ncbi:MAG: hypothetical protein ACPGVB_16580, partial [Chitinophagales bacterium]
FFALPHNLYRLQNQFPHILLCSLFRIARSVKLLFFFILFQKGYDGFVSLIPKTQLVDYYHEKYGFVQVGKQMAVFEELSQAIISKYQGDEKIYNELKKEYSDEEIADSMLIPADLTEEEQKQADEELRAFRFQLLRNQTEERRIISDLMRFRFQLAYYIKNQEFSKERNFGKCLEEYVRILNQSKKKLSEDLDIHYTRLSRIINDREEPNIELT